MIKAFAPAFALVAAVPALLAAAPVGTAPVGAFKADLDGDGRADLVSVRAVVDEPRRQELVALVRGTRFTARMPLFGGTSAQPLRVADVDGDGRDEVVVTESAGANTLIFSAWGLHGEGLRAVTTPGGAALLLAEGGGLAGLSGYGCEDVDGQRRLVHASGSLVSWDEPLVYEGHRVTYVVRDGVATAVSTAPVRAGRDDPAYRVDPRACA